MKRSVPDLRRRGASREPRRTFYIFCEGKNTEPAYLDALRRHHRDATIRIELRPAAGAPMTMALAAVEKMNDLRPRRGNASARDSFSEKDQVWVVFDRDEHHNVPEAIALCERSRVGIAYSNPCFELWLILHLQDFDRPDDRHAVQKHLQTLQPQYDPDSGKTPDCRAWLPEIEAAERRALRLLVRREQERDPYGVPSTTVGHLTAAVRAAAQASKLPIRRDGGDLG